MRVGQSKVAHLVKAILLKIPDWQWIWDTEAAGKMTVYNTLCNPRPITC